MSQHPQQNDLHALLDLMRVITSSGQQAPGFLEDALRRIKVRYGSPSTPMNDVQKQAAAQTQADIDNFLADGLPILYYSMIFEHHLDPTAWTDVLGNDLEQRLRAYRHIRHTVAHGFAGERAMQSKKDLHAFEAVMMSNTPLAGVEFNATHITRLSGALQGYKQLLHEAAHRAVANVANGNRS